jgi:dynein heavy chain, axonemal
MTGKTVLLENIGEKLDPVLDPLLENSTFMNKGVKMIRFDDNIIDYNDEFK